MSIDGRQLSRLLAAGDGPGLVDMLRVAPDVGSQLVGDALLLAVQSGVAGAAEIANRCSSALRARGWEGDDELAVQLDAATGAAPPAQLTTIAVDLEFLSDALEGSSLDDAGARIDVTTGVVWPESVLASGAADELDEDQPDDDDRWLWVEPLGPQPAYRDMVDFIATRTDPSLIAGLTAAVDGRGAFRRFRHVLDDWPYDHTDWTTFSHERRCGRARAWLARHGYRPASRPTSR